jgi:hypothetical protein
VAELSLGGFDLPRLILEGDPRWLKIRRMYKDPSRALERHTFHRLWL